MMTDDETLMNPNESDMIMKTESNILETPKNSKSTKSKKQESTIRHESPATEVDVAVPAASTDTKRHNKIQGKQQGVTLVGKHTQISFDVTVMDTSPVLVHQVEPISSKEKATTTAATATAATTAATTYTTTATDAVPKDRLKQFDDFVFNINKVQPKTKRGSNLREYSFSSTATEKRSNAVQQNTIIPNVEQQQQQQQQQQELSPTSTTTSKAMPDSVLPVPVKRFALSAVVGRIRDKRSHRAPVLHSNEKIWKVHPIRFFGRRHDVDGDNNSNNTTVTTTIPLDKMQTINVESGDTTTMVYPPGKGSEGDERMTEKQFSRSLSELRNPVFEGPDPSSDEDIRFHNSLPTILPSHDNGELTSLLKPKKSRKKKHKKGTATLETSYSSNNSSNDDLDMHFHNSLPAILPSHDNDKKPSLLKPKKSRKKKHKKATTTFETPYSSNNSSNDDQDMHFHNRLPAILPSHCNGELPSLLKPKKARKKQHKKVCTVEAHLESTEWKMHTDAVQDWKTILRERYNRSPLIPESSLRSLMLPSETRIDIPSRATTWTPSASPRQSTKEAEEALKAQREVLLLTSASRRMKGRERSNRSLVPTETILRTLQHASPLLFVSEKRIDIPRSTTQASSSSPKRLTKEAEEAVEVQHDVLQLTSAEGMQGQERSNRSIVLPDGTTRSSRRTSPTEKRIDLSLSTTQEPSPSLKRSTKEAEVVFKLQQNKETEEALKMQRNSLQLKSERRVRGRDRSARPLVLPDSTGRTSCHPSPTILPAEKPIDTPSDTARVSTTSPKRPTKDVEATVKVQQDTIQEKAELRMRGRERAARSLVPPDGTVRISRHTSPVIIPSEKRIVIPRATRVSSPSPIRSIKKTERCHKSAEASVEAT